MPNRPSRDERSAQLHEDAYIAAVLMQRGKKKDRDLLAKPLELVTKRDRRQARRLIKRYRR